MDWSVEQMREMTEESFYDFYRAVVQEEERRVAQETIPAQIESLNLDYLNAVGIQPEDPWQPPGTSSFLMGYPRDWLVTHENYTWRSTLSNNVWEPGVAGWQIETEEGEVAPWVQASGAGDIKYHIDSIVSHKGKIWRSTIDNNVWEPGVYGWEEEESSNE